MSIEIVGTGKALPSRLITNDYWTDPDRGVLHVYGPKDDSGKLTVRKSFDLSDTSQQIAYDLFIKKNMGPETRYWCSDDEDGRTLGVEALDNALNDAGMVASDLEGIVVGNVTHPVRWPSLACHIQEGIGARNASFVLDVGAACSGFTYAMIVGVGEVNRTGRPYAVGGVEVLSRALVSDDANGPLFGDGAGFVIIAPGRDGYGVLGVRPGSDPFDGAMDWLYQENLQLFMPNGKAVFENGVPGMKDRTKEAMLDETIVKGEISSIDKLICHQANIRMIRSIRRGLVDENGNLITIRDFGNMSSATCPVTLDVGLKNGSIQNEDVVGITALGGGISSAAFIHKF